jgi:hypothetical protein
MGYPSCASCLRLCSEGQMGQLKRRGATSRVTRQTSQNACPS